MGFGRHMAQRPIREHSHFCTAQTDALFAANTDDYSAEIDAFLFERERIRWFVDVGCTSFIVFAFSVVVTALAYGSGMLA